MANLVEHLHQIDNTIQYSWLMEIVRAFYGFEGDRITPESLGELFDSAQRADVEAAGWDLEVWKRSNLEAVYLTNEFDDPLEGWDTERYVPCLRTDDLVLKLHEPATIERLCRTTDVDVQDVASLRRAIEHLFERFVARARGPAQSACRPISFPSRPVPSGRPRRCAALCTRWTSVRTSTSRSDAWSSGPWPSCAPSFACRLT